MEYKKLGLQTYKKLIFNYLISLVYLRQQNKQTLNLVDYNKQALTLVD